MNAPSLIERLEGAAEGSRELDAEWLRTVTEAQVLARFGDYEWRPDGVGIWRAMPSPTTSLDAALALAERVLGEKEAMYALSDVIADEGRSTDLDLITLSDLPRLLCIAVLRTQEATL